MRRHGTSGGFTLVELLVVVAIIGIIAAIAIPNLLAAMERSRISRVAADLKTFETGFLEYALDNDEFPPDSHLDAPYHLKNGYGTEEYLPIENWVAPEPFGGHYNWEGPDNYPYAGISLWNTNATVEQAEKLDAVLDDGDLTTGAFRQTPNGRFTYIIDE